ncbi:MAG: hypothetical protein ACAH95_15705 [Fimbriimonas sp.]
MRYYVISNDGQRYGPADLATLNQWAQQGRLLANQLVEDETSGVRVVASSLPGLFFPQQQPSQAAAQPFNPTPSLYPHQTFVSQSWTLGTLGLISSAGICCCGLIPLLGFFLSLLGIILATRAHAAGNPHAKSAKAFNIFVLVICIVELLGLPFYLSNQGFSLS